MSYETSSRAKISARAKMATTGYRDTVAIQLKLEGPIAHPLNSTIILQCSICTVMFSDACEVQSTGRISNKSPWTRSRFSPLKFHPHYPNSSPHGHHSVTELSRCICTQHARNGMPNRTPTQLLDQSIMLLQAHGMGPIGPSNASC